MSTILIMINKKGFTLLELLIAAAIIGTLAVLATVSYRASEADTHVAAARAKVEVLANAAQRFALEYDHAKPLSGEMANLGAQENCNPISVTASGNNPATLLISCDFVDNGGWYNPYFHFYVCGGATDSCSGQTTGISNPLACMNGKGHSRMTDQYQNGYWYCVNATTTGEHFSN